MGFFRTIINRGHSQRAERKVMFGFKRTAKRGADVPVPTVLVGAHSYAGPWCGFDVIRSNYVFAAGAPPVFYLRKDGVEVAEGRGDPRGANLLHFTVPGTEALLRAVVDFMVAEHDRAVAAAYERERSSRIAEASKALGIQLEESA